MRQCRDGLQRVRGPGHGTVSAAAIFLSLQTGHVGGVGRLSPEPGHASRLPEFEAAGRDLDRAGCVDCGPGRRLLRAAHQRRAAVARAGRHRHRCAALRARQGRRDHFHCSDTRSPDGQDRPADHAGPRRPRRRPHLWTDCAGAGLRHGVHGAAHRGRHGVRGWSVVSACVRSDVGHSAVARRRAGELRLSAPALDLVPRPVGGSDGRRVDCSVRG